MIIYEHECIIHIIIVTCSLLWKSFELVNVRMKKACEDVYMMSSRHSQLPKFRVVTHTHIKWNLITNLDCNHVYIILLKYFFGS